MYHPAGEKKRKRWPKKEEKMRHRTNFEADRWPETGDFFGGALNKLFPKWIVDMLGQKFHFTGWFLQKSS